ncbi:hypothetical protein CCO03_17110 [Comamonas serinivorans]|uniref:Uncharacterized protein n=1 Tax=Comamonas serinivorans TaxID=1082851 RepID=A0A1Y0ER78_9BURK|nr:hypothetical protein [Comamonas serinivorans]ARU06165.1 hypothetical protein CCO03_17110 [Comamonas serinivorans]
MNLNDLGFKNPPHLQHPSDLAMDVIQQQVQAPEPPALLVLKGQIVHSAPFMDCWKLRELIRQCGGQVDMFTHTTG